MIVNRFWTIVLLSFIEIVKFAVAFLSLFNVIEARQRLVVAREAKDKPFLKGLLYPIEYWSFTPAAPPDYDKLTWKDRSPTYSFIRAAFWLSMYIVVQFGLTKDNSYSLAKLAVTTVAIAVLGFFVCFGDDTPKWHAAVMVIFIIGVCITLCCCTGVYAPYYDEPGNYSYYEKVTVSTMSTPELDQLELQIATDGTIRVIADGSEYYPDMEPDATLVFSNAPGTPSYITREEYREHLRGSNCRLDITWTFSSEHHVIYTVYYGDSPVVAFEPDASILH